jgi:uncharacterized protein YbjT (DUF2867 family)
MYVITGATGHTGSIIAEGLLAAGKKVRIVVRSPEKGQALAAKGAEIAVGSLTDAAFLTKAFAGATAAYLLIPPDITAQDVPAYQATIGEAQAKALRESRVRYAIHLSSMGAHTPVGTGVVAGLFWQERRLNQLPDTHVLHLRPGYFLENMLANIPMIKHQGMMGGPLAANARINLIATRDIAEYALKRFLALDFTGKEVQELLGHSETTLQDAATQLGTAIGKPDLKWIQFPYEDAFHAMQGFGLSASMARGLVDLSRFFNEDKCDVITRNAENTTPTSIATFAQQVFKPAYQAMA